jgi:chloramphenicol 3-O phosphotransferase
VTTQAIVLNGGSSSGKSSIAPCLQAILPDPWLSLSVDTFVTALPASLRASGGGIEIAEGGVVNIGPQFDALEAAWREGVGAMVRAGARVVVDDVFLGRLASQQRWQKALAGLDVLWVGVRCDSGVAAAREAARGDRATGMAALQAETVHQGVCYDLVVDTSDTEVSVCARTIAERIG